MANPDETSLISLNGLEDGRRAFLELLSGMRRTLYLYTPLIRPELYNDSDVLAAIRNRVVSQPKIRFHLLLPPAREWRSDCPGLVRLTERLTTALILRTLTREEAPDRPELGQAFAIVDERALLRFSDPRRLVGGYESQPSERMKELLELFRALWERAQPDPDLRRLGI
ncbi:MAG: hypothetical protein RKO66_05775 [Candidatus Contendobacter sp.]|nr:hypothetical protein [Candidatus Contendobacter sp.]MDS4060040.1 hypothetical protein [Candidatus Contendobacter sp.]